MSTIHYTACPVCDAREITHKITAKDHTVSGREFEIFYCPACTLMFTQDIPDKDTIGDYYKSEEYISHTNSSKGMVNRLYQLVRKRTLAGKRKLINKYTGMKAGRLLDIGSGTGAFANEMSRAGWDVTALEPDAEARALGKSLYGIEIKDSSLLYQLPEARFHAITMWHVLEHVHDLHGTVRKLKSLLIPGGKLFVAVPNYTSGDAVRYGAYWAAYDVPRHLYHFSPTAMERLMDIHGLKIRSHLPMWYDSFYVSLLSSRYKKGKVNFPGAFFSGLASNISAWNDKRRCSSVLYVIE